MGNKYTVLTLRTAIVLFVVFLSMSGLVIMAAAVLAEVLLHDHVSPELPATAAYVLFAVGLFYVVVSFFIGFALPGAGPAQLSVYGALLTIATVVNVGMCVSVATYRAAFRGALRDGLLQGVTHYRGDGGGGGHNYISHNMDFVQRKMECCGVSNYTDWKDQAIPISCCRNKEFICETNDRSKIFHKGCLERILTLMSDNTAVLVTLSVTATLYPLAGALLCCCLAHLVYGKQDRVT